MYSIGRGYVVDVQGEQVTVRLENHACQSCGMKCSTGDMVIGKNLCNAKKGQWVNLLEDEAFVIYMIFIQFGVPLFGFLTFAVVGYYLFVNELLSITAGLTGLFLSGFITKYLIKNSKQHNSVFIAESIVK